MRLLRRLRIAPHLGKVVVATVKLPFLFRPEHLHRLHRLPHLRPAMVEVAAQQLRLLPVPPRAHAEQEAAPAQQVERGDLFGQHQRVALRHQGDARAQLDGAGRPGRLRQRDVGIGEMRVRPGNHAVVGAGKGAGRFHRHNRVFAVPQGVESKLLRLARHERRVDGVCGQRHRHANVHINLRSLNTSTRHIVKVRAPHGKRPNTADPASDCRACRQSPCPLPSFAFPHHSRSPFPSFPRKREPGGGGRHFIASLGATNPA